MYRSYLKSFNIVKYYIPDRVPRQFGNMQGILVMPPKRDRREKVGIHLTNWIEELSGQIKDWKQRKQIYAEEIARARGGEVESESEKDDDSESKEENDDREEDVKGHDDGESKDKNKRKTKKKVDLLQEESMWNLRSRRDGNAQEGRTMEEPDVRGKGILK
ncbi:histone chaperone asf1-like [Amborella trichopoda]|uniref:histone chaperone asf1-like n=1 Tax=Amborella trichopoda TaxID=13333 RepID=UPI0009BF839E|nr:histone chaperone asf1-like [Amborella trichopoda]XP_020529452.1 histone chaperone asf1-like [Amborella trichopoda]|eukprot:XP_020529451.1 histone chaperone asf1-like [Amborella trichopoda]